jgi:hypothetical protein
MNPMMKAIVSTVLGVGIGAVAVYVVMRPPEDAGFLGQLNNASNAERLNSASKRAADMTKGDGFGAPKSALVTPLSSLNASYKSLNKPETVIFSAYRRSNALEDIYLEVEKRPNDAEAIYIKARILERCAARTTNIDPVAEARMEKEVKEGDKFVKELIPENDPERETRKAALERTVNWGCKRLRERVVSHEELNALYKTAADLGDPNAKLRQISCEIDKSRSPRVMGVMMSMDEVRTQLPTITESQVVQIASIVKLGNPAATARAYELLSNSYKNGQIKLGGIVPTIIGDWHRSRDSIAALLACDLGASCATDFQSRLDEECAFNGHCGITDFRQFVERFELTPARAQIADQLRRSVLDVILTGNAESIKFDPAPATGFARQDYSDNCGNR